MKLSVLLSKHSESTAANSLVNSFGDSFLLQNNSVYRHIRRKTLDLGFTYSSDRISQDYLAFPMSQLESILSQKVIPYLNNVSPLKTMNQKTSAQLDWDHVVDNLKPNFVFHESCHAVVRSFAKPTSTAATKITRILIEESFANTCEFLAIAEAQDPTHRLFLEMNSFFTVFEDRTHLKKAIDTYGLATIFKLMLISYLHSHFLNEDFSDSDFNKIVRLVNFKTEPDLKTLKSLARNAFSLNPRFRFTTTDMYLRLNGITTPILEALKFDYLKLIETDENLNSLIQNLTIFMGAAND